MPTIKDYLELPDGFTGDVEENWSLGPCINFRDVDNRGKVNGDYLVKMMKGLRYKIIRCHHWGFGWVEHLSFPVQDVNPEYAKHIAEVEEHNFHARIIGAEIRYPATWITEFLRTKELDVVEEWCELVDEWGIVDEEAYNALEDERIREEVECDHKDEVIEWMRRNAPEDLEEWVSPKAVDRARVALGLCPWEYWEDLVDEVGEEEAKVLWDKYRDVNEIDNYLVDKEQK